MTLTTPKLKLKRTPKPKEGAAQERIFAWAKEASGKWPELSLMFASLNGVPLFGPNKWAILASLKKRGMKAGVPDIFLPAVRVIGHHLYGGLFVELKRDQHSPVRPEQLEFIAGATRQGYACALCIGADEAIRQITRYLEGAKVTTDLGTPTPE